MHCLGKSGCLSVCPSVSLCVCVPTRARVCMCVCVCVLACLYGIKKKGSIVKLVTVCMYAFFTTHPTLHVRVRIGHTPDALSDLLALLTLPSSSLLHVMLESLGQDGNPSKLTEMAMKVST